MRIFLSAATENYIREESSVRGIFDLLLELGHTQSNPYASFMLSSQKSKRIAGEAKKMRELIRKSDLLLAEISLPSLGVGYNICLAQYYQLPIICLCQKEHKANIPDFIRNFNSQYIKIIEYTNINLKYKLKKAFTLATPKKIRFNMNLDQGANNLLNILSKEMKKNKTEIINDLIKNADKGKPYFVL